MKNIKNFLKKNIKYIFPVLIVMIVLIYSVYNTNTITGNNKILPNNNNLNISQNKENKTKTSNKKNEKTNKNAKKDEKIKSDSNSEKKNNKKTKKTNKNATTKKDKKSQSSENKKKEISCYISIDCSNVLDHMDNLRKNKVDIIPKSGIMLSSKKITLNENSSAYDLLIKASKQYSILVDSQYTAVYNSAYIRGINNLYEKDCGPSSGWIYKVNGSTAGFGCSQYILNSGDNVQFVFTTNRGGDV